jgi:hypothetical protein
LPTAATRTGTLHGTITHYDPPHELHLVGPFNLIDSLAYSLVRLRLTADPDQAATPGCISTSSLFTRLHPNKRPITAPAGKIYLAIICNHTSLNEQTNMSDKAYSVSRSSSTVGIRNLLRLQRSSSMAAIEQLKEGNWIVHKRYGIGQIQGVEEKEISGEPADYYRVETHNSIVWLPVDDLNKDAFRSLASPKSLKKRLTFYSVRRARWPPTSTRARSAFAR